MKTFEQFAALTEGKNAAKRGLQFETLLADIFRQAGYSVKKNPTTAHPRQSDLLARKGNQYFLVEAKWKTRTSDIDLQGQIESRLGHAAPGMVGCIFSMARYSDSLISEVELNRRKNEVLLFNAREIAFLANDPWSLPGLIERKRHHLRVQGKVFFLSGQLYATDSARFPKQSRGLELSKKCVGSLATKHSDRFSDVMLMADYPEAIELGTIRDCYRLEFYFSRQLRQDFKDLISLIHETFDISGDGNFSIHQNGASWHGIGLDDLFEELDRREQRYSETPPNHVHHSEQACYVGAVGQGLILIQFLNEIADDKHFYGIEVEFRLPGIPLNLGKYEEFFNTISRPMTILEPLKKQGHWVIRPAKTKLERIGNVIDLSDSHRGVPGIICANPFTDLKRIPRSMSAPKDARQILAQTLSHDRLVCRIRDWLHYDDQVDEFFPERFEIFHLGKFYGVHVQAQWGKLTSPPKISEAFRPSMDSLKSTVNRAQKVKEIRRQFSVPDT